MFYLLAFLTFLIGGVAGFLFARSKAAQANAKVRELQIQNTALQTSLDAAKQQSISEKQLLQDSFLREKDTLAEKHAQEIKLLTEQVEKTQQARLEQ